MKTRIWKKINERVRIEKKSDDEFVVEHRPIYSIKRVDPKKWRVLNMYSTFDKALKHKHNYIVLILMRDLGFRNEFVKRRTKRKK